MENAKKNLVFHFGVGRQASFPPRQYVKEAVDNFGSLTMTWYSEKMFISITLVWSLRSQKILKLFSYVPLLYLPRSSRYGYLGYWNIGSGHSQYYDWHLCGSICSERISKLAMEKMATLYGDQVFCHYYHLLSSVPPHKYWKSDWFEWCYQSSDGHLDSLCSDSHLYIFFQLHINAYLCQWNTSQITFNRQVLLVRHKNKWRLFVTHLSIIGLYCLHIFE